MPKEQGVSPVIVATGRGIILAAAGAAVTYATKSATDASGGTMAPYAPIVLAVLRVAEGWVDKARGQAPQKKGGSGPAGGYGS